ncbi:MAG: zinc-ribbon domain-containing protein [Candidatus Lokiarchaeota archaeon]|nr:zinc-ribbon domain-containing protein [Candidatus Lokiarchaeota archaeon]
MTNKPSLAALVVRCHRNGGPPTSYRSKAIYLAICPSCRKEVAIEGYSDAILYDCAKCKEHLLYEALCDACGSRIEVAHDELRAARGGRIRCHVCWEPVFI